MASLSRITKLLRLQPSNPRTNNPTGGSYRKIIGSGGGLLEAVGIRDAPVRSDWVPVRLGTQSRLVLSPIG